MPSPHSLHALMPGSSWYVPSRQMSHCAMPRLGAALATLHADGAVAPDTQYEPFGHCVHCKASERLVEVEK